MTIEEYLDGFSSNVDVFATWIHGQGYGVTDALMILGEFASKNITFPSNYAMNQTVINELKARKWGGIKETVKALNNELNPPPKKTFWQRVREVFSGD